MTVAGSSPVTEGQDALFTVTASRPPEMPLEVRVTITRDGNFVAARDRGDLFVVIAPGETSVVHGVPTLDGPNDEPDGVVHMRLRDGVGDVVGNDSTASVPVADNDPFVPREEPAEPPTTAPTTVPATATQAVAPAPAPAPTVPATQAEEQGTADEPQPDAEAAQPPAAPVHPDAGASPRLVPAAALVLLLAALAGWLIVAVRRRRDGETQDKRHRIPPAATAS